MSVHSKSSSICGWKTKFNCIHVVIWELSKIRARTETTETMCVLIIYFRDCDEIRAKEDTFHSLNFKQVPT